MQQKENQRHPPIVVENTSELFATSTKRELSQASLTTHQVLGGLDSLDLQKSSLSAAILDVNPLDEFGARSFAESLPAHISPLDDDTVDQDLSSQTHNENIEELEYSNITPLIKSVMS